MLMEMCYKLKKKCSDDVIFEMHLTIQLIGFFLFYVIIIYRQITDKKYMQQSVVYIKFSYYNI